jgi:hypothetical protein
MLAILSTSPRRWRLFYRLLLHIYDVEVHTESHHTGLLLRSTYWAAGGNSVASMLKVYTHFTVYLPLLLLAGFLFRRVRDRVPARA